MSTTPRVPTYVNSSGILQEMGSSDILAAASTGASEHLYGVNVSGNFDFLAPNWEPNINVSALRGWAVWRPSNTGATAFTVTGSTNAASAVGTGSSLNDSTGNYVSYVSSSTSGSRAGVTGTSFIDAQYQLKPRFFVKMKTGPNSTDILNVRLWVVLANIASNTLGGSDAPTAHLVGFRYATGTDGTAFWRCVTCDNSTYTTTTTSVAVAVDTAYTFAVDMTDPAAIKFYINGVLVATHTTHLPGATTNLVWECLLQNTTAVALNYRLGTVTISQL